MLSTDECTVHIKDKVKNLGVIFDADMNMNSQISSVCRAGYFHIRNIRLVRKYLTKAATKAAVHATVTSRLDSCNALLADTSLTNIQCLQVVQNTAARVVCQSLKYDHATPLLKDLHWLPIEKRIMYKYLSLVHKSIHGTASQYLQDLIKVYKPSRSLRSENNGICLVVP